MAKKSKKDNINELIDQAMVDSDALDNGGDFADQGANASKPQNGKGAKKSSDPLSVKDFGKTPSAKVSRAEKKQAKIDKKEKSKQQKEWEDSIVSNKRVKMEENRRRAKKILALILILSIGITSAVYFMIQFVDYNNVRITATPGGENSSLMLSMDNTTWTPYLDAKGPDDMKDISYNSIYNRTPVVQLPTAQQMLESENKPLGRQSDEDYISFVFMVRNTSDTAQPTPIEYKMNYETDERGLDECIRVMWVEYYANQDISNACVYAHGSSNQRIGYLSANGGKDPGQWTEKVAYPLGSFEPTFDMADYEFNTPPDEMQEGFFDAELFHSDEQIFMRESILNPGEIMYVYCSIWIEGSDLDTVDERLGSFVSLDVNFAPKQEED